MDPIGKARALAASELGVPDFEYRHAVLALLLGIYDRLAPAQAAPQQAPAQADQRKPGRR